jgi:hypothetical protein
MTDTARLDAIREAMARAARCGGKIDPAGSTWRDRCAWLISALDAALSRATAAEEENERLRSLCLDAAKEIDEHWDAHCDAEGAGPCNLVSRLRGRTGGGGGWEYAQLKAQLHVATMERDALRDQIEAGGCAAAHIGERTLECDATRPCGLCRLRGERDEARAKLAGAERGLSQTIDQRDFREHQLDLIHEALDCENEEWTNRHDLGACAIESVRAVASKLAQARNEGAAAALRKAAALFRGFSTRNKRRDEYERGLADAWDLAADEADDLATRYAPAQAAPDPLVELDVIVGEEPAETCATCGGDGDIVVGTAAFAPCPKCSGERSGA